jgi:transposase
MSKRGNKHLRSPFYFLAQMNYRRDPTLLEFHQTHRDRLKGRKLYTVLASQGSAERLVQQAIRAQVSALP